MASAVVEENATQLFARFSNDISRFSLERNLFSNLTSNDVVEIYGESGSGKTELLYHLIAQCILPQSWKGLHLDGSEVRVIFIDNDCHFNLFRLMTIIEIRLKTLRKKRDISSEEISLFISERIKLIEVIKCYDSQQFLITLCSLESLLAFNDTKSVMMIDGITSFYWCDKMRMQTQHKMLAALYAKINSVTKSISQNCKIPIFATKRRIVKSLDNDKKILGQTWKSIVTLQLQLTLKDSKPDRTIVTLSNITNTTSYYCGIGKFGFVIMHQMKE